MGSHKWSEDMETDHDLDTQEESARVLGSRWVATRTRTSHGGGGWLVPEGLFLIDIFGISFHMVFIQIVYCLGFYFVQVLWGCTPIWLWHE